MEEQRQKFQAYFLSSRFIKDLGVIRRKDGNFYCSSIPIMVLPPSSMLFLDSELETVLEELPFILGYEIQTYLGRNEKVIFGTHSFFEYQEAA